MPRISDFPIKSDPSASATLAGVDVNENGEKENIQIPISEFVTKDDNGNVTVTGKVTVKDGLDVMGESSIFRNDIIMQGGNVEITNAQYLKLYNEDDSKSATLECSDDGELLLDGKPVATKDDIPSDSNFVTKDENGDIVVHHVTTEDGIDCEGPLTVKDGNQVAFFSEDNSKRANLRCDDNGKLTLDGKEVATVDDIPSGGSGDSSIIDLGTTSSHKDAQQAIVDHLTQMNAEDGCYLFKYYCQCYGNGCFAVVKLVNDEVITIWGTVYDTCRSFRQFQYNTLNGFTLDGCWLTISSFDEDLSEALETENKEVIGAINELNSKIGSGSSGGSPMTSITYAELRALRDAGNLIPGMFYRITDYECTTAQENTRAMSHNFYIIVQALSCDTLSETAKADLVTDGTDDYFVDAGANVSAWEIKYCLDNDTTRFAWALDGQAITNLESMYSNGQPLVRQPSADGLGDGEYQYAWGTKADADDGDNTNFWYSKNEVITDCETVWCEGEEQIARVIEGKGVIYYMKDEHGNECPYDFKNIQFKRVITLDNGYPEYDPQGGYHSQEAWVYTFCGNSYHCSNDEWSELKDGSLENPYGHQSDEGCFTFQNNIMKPYIMAYDSENEDHTKCGKQYLNNNVFFGWWEEVGSYPPDAEYLYHFPYCGAFITLDYNCYNNTFGMWSNNIRVGADSRNNYIECAFSEIGAGCSDNTFRSSFLKIGNKCSGNITNCSYLTLGNGCWGNRLTGYNLILLDDVYNMELDDYPQYKIYKGSYEIV